MCPLRRRSSGDNESGNVEEPLDVRIDHPVPVIPVAVLEAIQPRGKPRVVDEDVGCQLSFRYFGDKALHRLTVADVDGEGIYLSVVPLDQLGLQFTEAVDAPGARMRFAPAAANLSAHASPMPALAPVISILLPCMRFSIFSVHQAF